jgi:hypothetical protein
MWEVWQNGKLLHDFKTKVRAHEWICKFLIGSYTIKYREF